MTQESHNQLSNLNGAELVVEFIEHCKIADGGERNTTVEMLEYVRKHYGCAPDELNINDEKAGEIIAELYVIAVADEFKAASLPCTSD